MKHIPTNVGETLKGVKRLGKINKELFTSKDIEILNEVLDECLEKEISKIKVLTDYKFSNKFNIRINQIFREQCDDRYVSHKKQDT